MNTFIAAPPISTRRSPKSICRRCSPGRVSYLYRSPGRGDQLPAQRRDSALHRAQAGHDALLAGQLLADHVGIAGVAPEPLVEPVRQSVQLLRLRR